MTFKLGTRGSPLALVQAHATRDALAKAHGIDPATIEIVMIKTTGDRVQDRALAEIGGKALWTKELDRALCAHEIDAAVHSMKDVETVRPTEIRIAAMLPRADVRDRLVGIASLADLPRDGVVGTSSPRRAAQVLSHRPDARIVLFRGNVDTRLAKLAAGRSMRPCSPRPGWNGWGGMRSAPRCRSTRCCPRRRRGRWGSRSGRRTPPRSPLSARSTMRRRIRRCGPSAVSWRPWAPIAIHRSARWRRSTATY